MWKWFWRSYRMTITDEWRDLYISNLYGIQVWGTRSHPHFMIPMSWVFAASIPSATDTQRKVVLLVRMLIPPTWPCLWQSAPVWGWYWRGEVLLAERKRSPGLSSASTPLLLPAWEPHSCGPGQLCGYGWVSRGVYSYKKLNCFPPKRQYPSTNWKC